ncbi:MAG: hypothetical protein P8Y97_04330, partial [Candidatus Lokiarchaeota archaeon]
FSFLVLNNKPLTGCVSSPVIMTSEVTKILISLYNMLKNESPHQLDSVSKCKLKYYLRVKKI